MKAGADPAKDTFPTWEGASGLISQACSIAAPSTVGSGCYYVADAFVTNGKCSTQWDVAGINTVPIDASFNDPKEWKTTANLEIYNAVLASGCDCTSGAVGTQLNDNVCDKNILIKPSQGDSKGIDYCNN